MLKRRTFTPEFRVRAVPEDLTGVKSAAEICREHHLSPHLLSRRKAEFLAHAPELFAAERCWGDEQERLAELEHMGGRLTMELEVSKKPPAS